jgi:hypothetical protein
VKGGGTLRLFQVLYKYWLSLKDRRDYRQLLRPLNQARSLHKRLQAVRFIDMRNGGNRTQNVGGGGREGQARHVIQSEKLMILNYCS